MTDVPLSKLTREQALDSLMTPMGKRLKVVKINNSSLYGLRFEDGGSLPPKLHTGKWTSPARATLDAKVYLNAMWDQADAAKAKKDRPLTPANREGGSKEQE